MMKMAYFLTALPVVLSLALSAAAQARTGESSARRQAHWSWGRQVPAEYWSWGREVPAPPYSFACMTDHGPSECGDQPMWVYGDDRAYYGSGLTR
jgi:hypothetical protein